MIKADQTSEWRHLASFEDETPTETVGNHFWSLFLFSFFKRHHDALESHLALDVIKLVFQAGSFSCTRGSCGVKKLSMSDSALAFSTLFMPRMRDCLIAWSGSCRIGAFRRDGLAACVLLFQSFMYTLTSMTTSMLDFSLPRLELEECHLYELVR